MYKKDTSLNYVSNRAVVVYLPGRKGNKNELSFLRKFITGDKKISFFSLSYALQDINKTKYPIESIILKIEKNIEIFLNNYHFKKCYLVGYSLGAALALGVVCREKIKFDKLILLSIFDDRKDLLKNRGIAITNKENISPIQLVKKNKKTPTIFIHGEFDTSVNIERGLKVYNKSQKQNNKFISLPTGHAFNDARSKKSLLESLVNII